MRGKGVQRLGVVFEDEVGRWASLVEGSPSVLRIEADGAGLDDSVGHGERPDLVAECRVRVVHGVQAVKDADLAAVDGLPPARQ